MTSRLKSLREALTLSPDNVPLLLLYAQAAMDEKDFAAAREGFERVLQEQPGHPMGCLGVAKVLFLSGSISEAIIRTETLIQTQPRLGDAWLLLAKLALAEGEIATAREHYQRMLQLDPTLRDPVVEEPLQIEAELPLNHSSADVANVPHELGQVEDDGPIELEHPQISFGDVGGMNDVKEEIRMKIIYPLQNRDLFRAYGQKVGGGVLLYGPPGCGKTLISRATAGEIDANFISVGIHDILDLYVGNSEKNLHQMFQLARDHAPAILFFDEVEALAADRKDFRESAIRTLINQFLAELDGNIATNEGVLVLGATNAPWHLDPAFRRPGRFDRIVFVPPPDESAREAIIGILSRGKPIKSLDQKTLAKKTREFSGADLKAVFEVATEKALARAMKQGSVVPLTTEDLLQVSKNMKPSTRAWFESAKNYALYANQGGFYDDILAFLGIRK